MSSEQLKPCPFCGGAAEPSGSAVGCAADCIGLLRTYSPSRWNTRPIEDALQSRLTAAESSLAEARARVAELEEKLGQGDAFDMEWFGRVRTFSERQHEAGLWGRSLARALSERDSLQSQLATVTAQLAAAKAGGAVVSANGDDRDRRRQETSQ